MSAGAPAPLRARLARYGRHQGRRAAEAGRDTRHLATRAGRSLWTRALAPVKAVYKELRRPVRAAARRRADVREQWAWLRDEWALEREIARAVSGRRPLVVGPWLSEVGYEVLYWIPFLRWVQAAFRLDPARVIAVSRGGTASWYADLADRYVDVWDLMSPEAYASRNAARGAVKQHARSPLDDEVLAGVRERIGEDVDVLHPGVMYRLFTLFWSGQRPLSFLDRHTRFARPRPPAVLEPGTLPECYVAVKLYAARSLPDTPEVREALAWLLSRLAARSPVVVLDTGLVLDEHRDHALSEEGRLISARPWMTPRTNLAVQTEIIAGADAYIGTCGSLAWLAPALGVDTSALYVDPKWLHAHLGVALRAYHRLDGAGRFAAMDLRALAPAGLPVPPA